MVLFTLFFTIGVWLLQQQALLPPFFWAGLLAGFPFALMIPTRTRAQQLIRMLLIAAIACGAGFFHAAWQAEQRMNSSLPSEWQGRNIIVTGVVAQLPHITERGQRFSFDVETMLTPGVHGNAPNDARPLSLNSPPQTGESNAVSLRERPVNVNLPERIYLATYYDRRNQPPELHAGERWQLTVRLKQPHGSINPNSFDFELWALENNVRATGYVRSTSDNFRLDPSAAGLSYRIEAWREAVRDKYYATLGGAPYAGVLTALAIGDQGSISDAQWQVFRRTGVIHLMSISGLHITMLAGMGFALIYWLWRRSTALTLWLPARRAAAIAALLAACAYAQLAGYGVPAQRTVYMVAAAACALWLNRNFSLTQILSIALLGVLLPDPWAVLSPGFWLSFGAVALILYVTAHRIRRAEIDALHRDHREVRMSTLLREYATVQWAMSIGLIPLLLALFGQISLVSPVANAIAIPLVSLIVVPLALLGAALPTEVPLWLAHIAMDLTMVPLQFFSDLPQAVWTQHEPPAWSIVFGMLGVIWVLAPDGFPARHLGLLLMLPMFLNRPEPPATGSLRLIVFDVGQGLSAAVQTRHHALLYDTGPDFSDDAGNLIPGLRFIGISTLDGLILSHDDMDHAGGTASVLQAMPVGWILSSMPLTRLKTVASDSNETRRCQDGMSWDWDGVKFEILHPDRNSLAARPHDNSCVLRISTGNHHILAAGDIEKRGEQRLLEKHAARLPASLLIVPHHGSSSSSDVAFVAAVLPDYAVFTAGYRNRFGHPAPQILQRYLDSGAAVLRSDQDGAILVEMNALEMTVERYRNTHQRYWTHRSE